MRPAIRVRTPREIRSARRPRRHKCWGHLVAAALWPMHDANLGTLLRTCDAVGACLAVPPFGWVDAALARGNTLRQPACVHRVGSPLRWLADERQTGASILGVELADEAIRLADLPAARRRTIMVLGHEATGIPPEALDLLDDAVEIPMVGTGASLNVAVAGSLVLYKLAGLL
ncbi:RNA methyltransferase [Actinoplanes sp. ATCC 53533]|nr:RNA methyltransferase [Actinoplanes sp. ATCC 53533]